LSGEPCIGRLVRLERRKGSPIVRNSTVTCLSIILIIAAAASAADADQSQDSTSSGPFRLAQNNTSNTSSTQPKSSSEETALEEIVVTAQHRSQPLEEVPISVAAIAGKDLDKLGVRTLRDLQEIVPSFQVQNSGTFTQLSIRGITSTALGPGIENNIAVYIDGFYEPDSSALGSDFANVSDIQVLKGPQGTLYGRNATGGALLVNTYEPSDQHPIIEAGASYGNMTDRSVRTYLGLPITEGLSFGIGAYYRANDGWIKNVDGSLANPYKDAEIRAKLKWEPTSNLSFVLGENYFYKSDPTFNAWTAVAYSPYGIPVGPLYTNKVDYISQSPNPVGTVRLDETTLRSTWITDYGTFTSHTSYTDEKPFFNDDYDATLLQFQQIPARFSRYTFLEQLDYDVKPISSLEIQAGGLYFHDDSSDNVVVDLLLPALGLDSFGQYEHNITKMVTTAYAGYIDATWEAVENLFFNAGVRYSDDKRTVSAWYISAIPFIQETTPGYPTLAPETTASFPATTPRATIRYQLAPRTDVYFSYSQGFKSGTFNTVATTEGTITAPVQPEHVTAYEVGFKTEQARYHFETAAYFDNYKDLQVNALGSDPITHQVLVTLTNAATARIYGAEASLAFEATSSLNVRAAVAYTHARYLDFQNASANIPSPLADPTTIVGETEDLSGRRIARAPDWTANIGADYSMPLPVGKMVLSGNVYYTSAYAPLTEAYNPSTGANYYYDNGYALVNGALTWVQDHYNVGLYVNDLANKRYFLINQSAPAAGLYQTLSSPRTYGIRFNYSY
jgi:iron complex outermembrane receptor protein